jgi:hypothetical protein
MGAAVHGRIETRDSLNDIGVSTTLDTRPSAKTVRTRPFSTVWATADKLLKNMAETVNVKRILIRKSCNTSAPLLRGLRTVPKPTAKSLTLRPDFYSVITKACHNVRGGRVLALQHHGRCSPERREV